MKKQFILLLISLSSFNLFGQSGGGTSIERKLDRLAEDIERLSDRLSSKTERLEASAENFAETLEEQWENNWSVALNEFGEGLFTTLCPAVGYLGIEASEVPVEKAKKLGFENRYGSYVSKVLARSSAESAGLQAFDYIYGVDEQRTSNNQSLTEILEDYEPGDEVTLYYVRKGQKMTAKVKLSDNNFDYESEGTAEDGRAFLGVSSKEENVDEAFDGVEVDIVEKSTAEEMGLQVGDVITSINGFPVLDWTDVTTAIQNTKPGENIEVAFKRGEKELSAKGKIKSYDEVYPNGNGSWNLDVDWDQTGNVEVLTGDDWQQDEDWEQDENRPFLGIFTEMISKEKANKLGFDNQFGTYVTGIIPNSGAEKAGLKPFDYIYGFDEYRAGEQQSLGAILKKYKPGDKTTVHFIRKGNKTTASLTFTKPIKAEKKETNSCQDPFFGIVQSGGNSDNGVTISPQKGSTAYDMGLQGGDIITHINGYQLVDWQDVTTAIGMLVPGETIAVTYVRDGKEMKSAKPIKSLAETKNCPNCDCGEKESVVIATTPGTSIFRGKPDQSIATAAVPRMSVDKVKVNLNSLSAEDASKLRSTGINLPESSTLVVEGIKLKPNSATGMFDLEFNLPTNGNAIVKVFNSAGRSLYEYDLGEFSGRFNDSIDITQNGPGNYFLEISQSGKVYTKKITLSKD